MRAKAAGLAGAVGYLSLDLTDPRVLKQNRHIITETGIGHLIASWGENFQMKQLFGGVILLATAAILFNEALRWMEHRVSTWRA